MVESITRRTDTSSIGPQWPPEPSSFNRIKGIDNRAVIRSRPQLIQVLNEIGCLRDRIMTDKGSFDRLSIRLIVEDDVWMQSIESFVNLGEAVIPLSGTGPEFEHTSILYLGHNADTRQPDFEDLNRALKNVDDALKRKPSNYKDVVSRVTSQGFTLSTLSMEQRCADLEIQNQMARLYQRFGWKREDVLDILGRETNIIAVAFYDGEIVSAGLAELSAIRFLDGNELRMAEISEAATDKDFQSRGLYSAVSAKLLRELQRRSNESDIFGGQINFAFGELNGNELGVLNNARTQGRTLAIEVSRQLELPFKGYLPQHCPIAGSPRKTPYNDLFPSFITSADMLSFLTS